MTRAAMGMKRSHMLVGLVVVVHGLLFRSLFSSFSLFDQQSEGWNEVDAMIQSIMLFDPLQLTNVTLTPASTDNTSGSGPNSDTVPMKIIPAHIPHHDERSLTSYMWLKGKKFNPQLEERPPERAPLVIDAVSIGTQFNVAQMEGQAASWGSHWSMRYLFGTTEQDDADPYCHKNITDQQVSNISIHCRNKEYLHNEELKSIRYQFPIEQWIFKKAKPKGWLCAQQRFAHAIGKVGRFYRREGPKSLPDFFFIQDDDTWYGMNKLLEFFSKHDQQRPHASVGCTVLWPVHMVNFSFPFGGFGTMMNRLSLERLIKPIYCNGTFSDQHTEHVCMRLKENLAGEQMAFQNGMSVSDLMDRHATMHPYIHFEKWGDPGYCMLGDWVMGFYFNYYEIGSDESIELKYMHVDADLGVIYKKPNGACRNHNVKFCRKYVKYQHVCHRMTPDHMHEMSARDIKKNFSFNRSLLSSFCFDEPTEGRDWIGQSIQSTTGGQFKNKVTTTSPSDQPGNLTSKEANRSTVPCHHDQNSLTSYMWLKGEKFNPMRDERPPPQPASLIIDAVSIGTQFNVAQMEGQAASWGSHWSMRYLFGTTEQDDADPYCHKNMTDEQFSDILLHCKKKVQYPNKELKMIRTRFPSDKWVGLSGKTKGWLCAQPRFAHAIGKVGRFYRREGLKRLPDFFFIQDDDTWFGMNKLLQFFSSQNQTAPFTTAGCVVRWPIHLVNFTFPFGGFGTMMNRLSLERLIKPIYCNETSWDQHTELVCLRLRENRVGEQMAFQEGMSVSDLMDRHASMHPYANYKQWGAPGYCMLGDWVIGYYFNYYGIGSPTMKPLEYVHMDESLGYLYKMPGSGACLNHNVKHCLKSKRQYTCHRMKPDHMHEMSAIDGKVPSSFSLR